jgi:hypothetical protein
LCIIPAKAGIHDLLSPVDFATITDFDDVDAQHFIFKKADDAVIAHAIFPKVTKL